MTPNELPYPLRLMYIMTFNGKQMVVADHNTEEIIFYVEPHDELNAAAVLTTEGKEMMVVTTGFLAAAPSYEYIEAVLAHERGHIQFRHNHKTVKLNKIMHHASIPTLLVIIISMSMRRWRWVAPVAFFLFNHLPNFISRRHEFEADAFAKEQGYGELLVEALKILEEGNKEFISEAGKKKMRLNKLLAGESHPSTQRRFRRLLK